MSRISPIPLQMNQDAEFMAIVLMPVHDTPATLLNAALASVAAQTYQNKRLLLHDDASCAETAGILQQFANQHSDFVQLRRDNVNGGIAHSRNALLGRVQTEYAQHEGVVIWLDSDDQFSCSSFICAVCARMRHSKAAVCFLEFDLLFCNENKAPFVVRADDFDAPKTAEFVEMYGQIDAGRLAYVRKDLRALAQAAEDAPNHALPTSPQTVLSATLCWTRMFSIAAFTAQAPVRESVQVNGKPFRHTFEDYLYSVPLFYDIVVTALPPNGPERIIYTIRNASATGAQKNADLTVARYERLCETLEAVKNAPASARAFAKQFFDWKYAEITQVVVPRLIAEGSVTPEALEEFKARASALRQQHFPE